MSSRNLRRVAVFLAAVCTTCTASAQAPLKVGTVDVARVVKEHPKTKEAEIKVNEAGNKAKTEFDGKTEEYKKLLDDINKTAAQAESAALSAEAKSAKVKERDAKIPAIRKMEGEITEFRARSEQQLQQQVAGYREVILKEITDAVMEQVKAKNLDFVFDKSGPGASGISPVLFSQESADFTAEVIAAVQKRGAAPAAPAAAATATAKPTKR